MQIADTKYDVSCQNYIAVWSLAFSIKDTWSESKQCLAQSSKKLYLAQMRSGAQWNFGSLMLQTLWPFENNEQWTCHVGNKSLSSAWRFSSIMFPVGWWKSSAHPSDSALLHPCDPSL